MENATYKTLTEASKDLNVTPNRLRDWTNRDLIKYSTRSNNVRMIPVSEYPKIEKIRDFFNEAKANNTKKTFEDLKEELLKDNLLVIHQKDQEQKKQDEIMLQAVENALDKARFPELIEIVGSSLSSYITKDDLDGFESRIKEVLNAAVQEKLVLPSPTPSVDTENLSTKEDIQEMKELLLEQQDNLEKEVNFQSKLQRKDAKIELLEEENKELKDKVEELTLKLGKAVGEIKRLKQIQLQQQPTKEEKKGWFGLFKK